MKIAAMSDIHYTKEMRSWLESVVMDLQREDISVLVLAGDLAGYSPGDFLLKECLSMFDGFTNKIFVPGNHELWIDDDSNSILTIERYSSLEELSADFEFHFLDSCPIIIDSIAFVGNMGWFDYSLRQKNLRRIPRGL